jgi:hypothetical protein
MMGPFPDELVLHVERAVASLCAGSARKRQMQEELLGHLVAVYEEELSRAGDEREAVARARERFGDPEALAGELFGCVPRLERWLVGLGQRKETIMWRWGIGLGLVAFYVGLGFVMPAIAYLRSHGIPLVLVALPLMAGTTVSVAGVVSVAWGVRAFRLRRRAS